MPEIDWSQGAVAGDLPGLGACKVNLLLLHHLLEARTHRSRVERATIFDD